MICRLCGCHVILGTLRWHGPEGAVKKPCFACTSVPEYTPLICDGCARYKGYLDAYKARMAWARVSAAEREGMIARQDRERGRRTP